MTKDPRIQKAEDRPMRIAILGTRGIPLGYSGYETFAQEVGPRLVERGHEVTVYCRSQLFPQRPREFRGVRLVYLPAIHTKSLSTFTHTFLSALHLAFRRADVALFVNVANSPFCLVTRLAGIGTVINVDGMEWLRPKWGPLGKKYFLAAARICKRTAHAVVTDAARMQEIYRDQFGVESADIAYGANVFRSADPERLAEYGLVPGKYYLTACRLVPDNNVDVLVRGFAQADTDRTYAVVGDTPYASSYVNQLTSCTDTRVKFLGHIDDQSLMDELYAGAYGYLHGHQFGGTNPTLLRAMAGGSYVLALDTPFNREVLDNCGVFFSKDAGDVAGKIRAAENDPQMVSKCSEMARQRIETVYTWDIITGQYEALCRQLIGGS